ncbi:redox-regulated ATPase YchF [Candidatus Mcinerneyibacteriota bacterium]|nr:redox-regulated ATPase YchF [Candidatus Mcinerneyibacteriota bacterium]
MNLSCGIIGKPFSGKSTLFTLMTGEEVGGKFGPVHGIAKVKDLRIDLLSRLYQPKKTTLATIEYIDVPGVVGVDGSENKMLEHVRNTDSLLAVVGAFEEKSEPDRIFVEIQNIRDDLLLNDLILVENRLEKIKHQRNPQEKEEFTLFSKLHEALEKNIPLRNLDLKEDEIKAIKGFQFFTLKPALFVINIREEDIPDAGLLEEKLRERLGAEEGAGVIALSVLIEEEIMQLPGEDREAFLQEMNISEPATEKVVRATYDLLGLISFFTTGEDEVKAWTIRKGTVARAAAGEIHSDIERGFIKAELVHYEDFVSMKDMKKLKEAGLIHLEGKDYIVRDGDIINFKFNV